MNLDLSKLISRARADGQEAFQHDLRSGDPNAFKTAGVRQIIAVLKAEGIDTLSDCEEVVNAACQYADAFRDAYSTQYFTRFSP